MFQWLWDFLGCNNQDDGDGGIVVDGPAGVTVIDLDQKEVPMENKPDHQSPPYTHDWDQWEVIRQGDISKYHEIIGIYVDQKRRCKTCGKTEIDTQTAYIDQDE